jgi:hypothetical protein
MDHPGKYLIFYLGCETNKGKFIGIRYDTLFIETQEKSIQEYNIRDVGNTLFFYLRHLNNLSDDERKQLITEGLNIGRPAGYSFTNDAFVYLLSLSIDLFGLIHAGFALDKKTLNEKDDDPPNLSYR